MVNKATKKNKIMVTYWVENGWNSWVDQDLKLAWMFKMLHGGLRWGSDEVYIRNMSRWGAGTFGAMR